MITWESPVDLNYDPESIAVPMVNSEGEIVILQDNYQINGKVQYYDKCVSPVCTNIELFEIPDVDLTLIKQPDGSSYIDTTYDTTLTN